MREFGFTLFIKGTMNKLESVQLMFQVIRMSVDEDQNLTIFFNLHVKTEVGYGNILDIKIFISILLWIRSRKSQRIFEITMGKTRFFFTAKY